MHSELKDYLLNEGKAPLDYVLINLRTTRSCFG